MSEVLLTHADIYTDERKVYLDGSILIDDGKIIDIYHGVKKNYEGKIIDLKGNMIIPSFFSLNEIGDVQKGVSDYLRVDHMDDHALGLFKYVTEDSDLKDVKVALVDRDMILDDGIKVVLGIADIKDIDSFRKKIYDELDIQYNKESERMFYNNAVDTLINNITFNLPDDFLKRLIIANSEGKLTREEVDQNYEKNYLTGMKWQLIEDYIVGKYPELAVNEDDLSNFVKTSYFGHLNNDTMDDEMKERMNNIIDTVLKDQQQRSYITNQIISNKLTAFFNENLKVEPVNVNYEEFMKATMPELDKKEEVEETKE